MEKENMRTSPQELFEAGVHIGHQRKRWNPKTLPYIFDHRNGITIIDLVKTCEQVEKACDTVKNVVSGGGNIWFIGTKKQANDVVKEGAMSVEMPFCVNRWVGGTLTNFQTIERSLNKYRKFLKMDEAGEIAKMFKKEGAAIRREMARMHSTFEGLMQIEGLPEALFVVDVMHEYISVLEAKKIGIPVIAIVDTNSDPTLVDYPIMCNDDSGRAIRMIVGLLLEGIQEGIAIRGERKSSKKKLLSAGDLVQIVPEVSISQEIVDEMSAAAAAQRVETEVVEN
ncbi:MAG: 30S ribosomal protein S2 [Puniceicoccales bacterium]|jgi:small subunit ribosomal protein S2|nr:30S ribosomal protein S2 [Puniceicoccales bacterium]